MVSLKKGEKTGLRSGGPLCAAETYGLNPMFDFKQVEHEFVAPKGCPFADRRKLGRLKMCISEAGQVFPVLGKSGEIVDDTYQLIANQAQSFAHEDQVGVVRNVTTGGAEVNDWPAERGNVAERVNVGHHVMSQSSFVLGGAGEIDVIQVCPKFGDLFCGNPRSDAVIGGQAEVMLGLGERQPQPPPGRVFALRSPQVRPSAGRHSE